MNHLFTRIASIVLAFGLFISCNTFRSTSDHTNTKELTISQLRDKVTAINHKLASDTTSSLLYQKGSYLIKLAQKNQYPQKRTSIYVNARNNLHEATKRSENTPDSLKENIRELLNVNWSREHNSGVQLIQSDSTLESQDYLRAAAHFNNATAIIPDSAVSYKMGARAYYQSQHHDRAIGMLKKAQKRLDNMPVELLEQLAFLYLESDNPDDAIAIYEEAESFSQQNLNLLHGLSNAYINGGKHEQATELLTTLVEQKPENIIYKQSLATQRYYLASKKINSTQKVLTSSDTTVTDLSTVDSLLHHAKTHLIELTEQNPENLELTQQLAQFYLNSASDYQQLAPLLDSQAQAAVEQKISDYLTSALPLFEKLVKEQPQQKVYWQNLYQTYSYLGMEEKARNAKSNL